MLRVQEPTPCSSPGTCTTPFVRVPIAPCRPTQDHTLKLLQRLREQIPGLALRTTFISGFPGEAPEQHKELVKVGDWGVPTGHGGVTSGSGG